MKKSKYQKPSFSKNKLHLKFMAKRGSRGYTEGPIYLSTVLANTPT